MSPDLQKILEQITGVEGGFVNDPVDPGGATQWGVSLRFAKEINLDLNHDGVVDVEDIKLITRDLAESLFLDHFVRRPKIDTLRMELVAQMADFAVNSGPPRAIITLQEVLNKVREAAPDLKLPYLDDDGVIGGETRRAAGIAQAAMGPFLGNALADAREAYLRGLAERDPKKQKYIVAHDGGPGGWITRARSFKVAV